jgi:cysteine synthase
MSKGIYGEENLVESGDLVKRMVASHYTGGQRSDAVGVVLKANFPLARVYFYDTKKEEIWNQKVLEKVSKGINNPL